MATARMPHLSSSLTYVLT